MRSFFFQLGNRNMHIVNYNWFIFLQRHSGNIFDPITSSVICSPLMPRPFIRLHLQITTQPVAKAKRNARNNNNTRFRTVIITNKFKLSLIQATVDLRLGAKLTRFTRHPPPVYTLVMSRSRKSRLFEPTRKGTENWLDVAIFTLLHEVVRQTLENYFSCITAIMFVVWLTQSICPNECLLELSVNARH